MRASPCIAVIPARGGSKGIPQKNIRRIGGQPLLSWTIQAALAARHVDRVLVSTDDAEIADVALNCGAEVIERPRELSGDGATSESALLHCLEQLRKEGGELPELLAFLQCTSPLTTGDDIDGAIETLVRESADTAVAVVPFHYFLWRRDGAGCGIGINHDKRVRKLRQEREPEFLESGAIYVMRTVGFLETRHRFFGKTVLYEMPVDRRWEIDDPVDLKVAEVLLSHSQKRTQADSLPTEIQLIVFDFDGVLTDNRVLVSEDGLESVVCDRADGMAIEWLRDAGIPAMILSKEKNPVVEARARKLQLPVAQGVLNKPVFLRQYCEERQVSLGSVVYVGNDLNDLECMKMVGCPVSVADAYPQVREAARIHLSRPGGRGAVREIVELILSRSPSIPASSAGQCTSA